MSTTHGIYKAFDCSHSLDLKVVIMDISKAFNKVWHEKSGLLYKFKLNGLNGTLLKLKENALSDI